MVGLPVGVCSLPGVAGVDKVDVQLNALGELMGSLGDVLEDAEAARPQPDDRDLNSPQEITRSRSAGAAGSVYGAMGSSCNRTQRGSSST